MIRINLPILAFSVILAVMSGLLFGLMPSLRMSRPDIAQMMQTLGRKVAGGKGQARSLNLLIAAQIALTVVLMGAAGVAIDGFLKMTHRDFGYDPAHLMSVPMPFHRHSLLTREHRAEYIETLRRKIATVPGVAQVAISADATPPDSGESRPFEILGAPFVQRQFMRAEFTDAQYFSALRIPLLEGRLWDETENTRGAAVCIINQTLAREYFTKGNAIGSRIHLPDLEIPAVNPGELVGVADTTGWLQVIGVVADSLDNGLDKPVLPAVYVPYSRFMWEFTQFLIRTDGPPLAVLHPIQLAIQSITPISRPSATCATCSSGSRRSPRSSNNACFPSCSDSFLRLPWRSRWSVSTASCLTRWRSAQVSSASAWPWAHSASTCSGSSRAALGSPWSAA